MDIRSLLKKKITKTLFTTPSHGRNLCILHKYYQWYRSDISEVEALDPETALDNAEKKAATIYKTKSTHFLTNGSTSGIIAAVLTCCKPGDKLLIWEKSHPSHRNAGILAGTSIIEYKLNFNEEWGIPEKITPKEVEELLMQHCPKAIIITSPTYEGIVSDIENIGKICKKYNTYLIVDEAHGALYPFSKNLPQSAIPFADFTIQSLHKTAGGINPTALLHSNCDLNIKKSLSLINTTSPSYPMLATIEANVNYLNSQKGRNKIEELISEIKAVRDKLKNLEFYGDDVTKLLIKKQGLSGYKLSEILYNKYNIEDERTNERSTLLLTGLGTTEKMIKKLEKLAKL